MTGKYWEMLGEQLFPVPICPPQIPLGLNYGFRDEMTATNLLSHVMALSLNFVVAVTDNGLSKKSLLFLKIFFGLSP
jgi:hypothetical protein